MSLIIAKIIDGSIQFESDTKISGENVIRNNATNGRLKVLILSYNLVLSYAGDIALAEDAYNYFVEKAKIEIKWNDYILFLSELSKTNQVDFILAGYNENPFIFKIKNGVIESTENAWIGDYYAFCEFQKYFNEQNDNNISNKFTNSFNKVITNQLNESVGEFHITVKANLNDFRLNGKLIPVFQYKIKSNIQIGRPKNISFNKDTRISPIPSGNSFEGDYSISHFTNPTQEYSVIAIYFEYAKFGLFYKFGNLLSGIIYRSSNSQDFVNEIFKETGFELEGFQVLNNNLGFKFIKVEKNKKERS